MYNVRFLSKMWYYVWIICILQTQRREEMQGRPCQTTPIRVYRIPRDCYSLYSLSTCWKTLFWGSQFDYQSKGNPWLNSSQSAQGTIKSFKLVYNGGRKATFLPRSSRGESGVQNSRPRNAPTWRCLWSLIWTAIWAITERPNIFSGSAEINPRAIPWGEEVLCMFPLFSRGRGLNPIRRPFLGRGWPVED